MLKVLRFIALALLPALLTWPASAETYPSRTVRLIVPFGAGGPADVYARILAKYLSEETKQSFVVEDRPGAGLFVRPRGGPKSPPRGLPRFVDANPPPPQRVFAPKKAVSADARLRAGG